MQMIITLQNKQVGTEINSVNARELHSFIQAKQEFANWIKNRIKKYGFVENQDYIIVQTKRAGNNATLKEYYITLDMAKELSMVENNEKGREARRYFIEVEKQHSSLKELQEIILQQNTLIASTSDTIETEREKHKHLTKLYEKTLNENETLKQKMKQQLSLIVSQVSQEIMTRFEESLEVTSRSLELQRRK